MHLTPDTAAMAFAADVLDELAAGKLPERVSLVRAAMGLAQHILASEHAGKDAPSAALHAALSGLEQLAIGREIDLGPASLTRARELAAALRCEVGVH